MAQTRTEPNGLARLEAIQARVRTLARNHDWLAGAIRSAFAGYLAIGARFVAEKTAMHERERRLAREVLAEGWLFDPKCRDGSPCLFVPVEGLCPVALREQLRKHPPGQAMPRELERDGAAAALAALDRDAIYLARDLPEMTREAMTGEYRAAKDAKTHDSFVWRVVVSRPADWQEPADPHSLNRADLERFSEADFRTIALYRLGGLADTGSVRPIVGKPTPTGDMMKDVPVDAAWLSRFPIDEANRYQNRPSLSPRALPPEIAEQLLDDVETWVEREAATRNERPAANPGNAPKPGSRKGQSTAQNGARRAKADQVRELLCGAEPFEGTKAALARQVGYSHSSSLSSIKQFSTLWEENERKLAQKRAERQRAMLSQRTR